MKTQAEIAPFRSILECLRTIDAIHDSSFAQKPPDGWTQRCLSLILDYVNLRSVIPSCREGTVSLEGVGEQNVFFGI